MGMILINLSVFVCMFVEHDFLAPVAVGSRVEVGFDGLVVVLRFSGGCLDFGPGSRLYLLLCRLICIVSY